MILIYFNTDIPYHYYSTIKLSNSKKKHDIIILPISAWMKKALLFWIYPYFYHYHHDKKTTQKCLFIAFSHSVFSPVHFSSVVFWLRETAVIPNHQIHIYCYIYTYIIIIILHKCEKFLFSPSQKNGKYAVIRSLRQGKI